MATSKKLMEEYEEILFTIMMEKVMEEEGAELIEENARLKNDPTFVIPEQTDQACLKTIEKAFSRQKRKTTFHAIYRGFQHVSVAVFALLILFTGVYAAVPPVRVATLNLLIEVSDVSTGLSFREEEIPGSETVFPSQAGTYIFSELPDGVVLVDEGSDSLSVWRNYLSATGGTITFQLTAGSINNIHRIDTEDANSIENFELSGNECLLIEKDGQIRITMADQTHQLFIDIICVGISREDALNLAYSLEYVE